jgi:hypothetical protein
LEFRLVYKGRLPSGTKSRIADRNRIRLQIHEQLKRLWNLDPHLRAQGADGRLDRIADNYKRGDLRIVPLITESNAWVCALDILFLRRDPPGRIVSAGGDLDNRIKVLFDGLRIPRDQQEMQSDFRHLDGPLFCLMEDDALIVEVKVTTDRLLVPVDIAEGEADSHVQLVIHVRTDMVDMIRAMENWEP